MILLGDGGARLPVGGVRAHAAINEMLIEVCEVLIDILIRLSGEVSRVGQIDGPHLVAVPHRVLRIRAVVRVRNFSKPHSLFLVNLVAVEQYLDGVRPKLRDFFGNRDRRGPPFEFRATVKLF